MEEELIKKIAPEINQIFHEIEIDKIIQGLKENCTECNGDDAINCASCKNWSNLETK